MKTMFTGENEEVVRKNTVLTKVTGACRVDVYMGCEGFF